MGSLGTLLACVGEWRGINHLHETSDGPADESASPGPDWGWRIVVGSSADGGGMEIVMYNIDPVGNEALAVKATHTRA